MPDSQDKTQRAVVLARAIVIALAALTLLWPIALNRAPFLFLDSIQYANRAGALQRHMHIASPWPKDASNYGDPDTATAPASAGGAAKPKPNVILGRSVYYSAFMALAPTKLFGALYYIQALLVALALFMLSDLLLPGASERKRLVAFVASILVSLVTTLPFYASFLMPDLFSAIGALAIVALCYGWRQLGWGCRLVWIGLLTMACLFHSSNIATTVAAAIAYLGLAVVAMMTRRWRGRLAPASAVALVLCALIGWLGDSAFSIAVKHATGVAPIRPPFVAARLVADGPGAAYLQQHCARSHLELCHFRKSYSADSDEFLWSRDPRVGRFMLLTPEQQRRVSAEQFAFLAEVVRANPGGVIRAFAHDAAKQIGSYGLSEFNYGPDLKAVYRDRIPATVLPIVEHSAAWDGRAPIGVADALTLPLVLLALVALAICSVVASDRAVWAGWGAAGVILLNDILCGVLSTPHDRYQARLLWVLPVLATMIVLRLAYLGAFRAARRRRV